MANDHINAASRAPLQGVRVVALEHFVSAPFATRHLGDLGADVIKIERPGTGDPQRNNDIGANGMSANFVWNNRNKRSLALDIKSSNGLQTLKQLVWTTDVFVHNLTPGVVEQMGCGYSAMAANNPRLISCMVSGFGAGGPFEDRKAMDAAIQGEAGAVFLNGTRDTACRVGLPIADIAAGFSAALAITAALTRRERTGEGAEIKISMLDALSDWCIPQAVTALYSGREPERTGGRNPVTVPHGLYHCANGEMINVIPLGQWNAFCASVLDLPQLATNERFATNALRVANRDALEAIIEDRFSTLSRQEVARRLTAIGAAYGMVSSMHDVMNHPQLVERDRWYDMATPVGPIRSMRSPIEILGVDWPETPVPSVGQHTQEILDELSLFPKGNDAPR